MKIEDFRPIRSQDSAPIKFDWLLTQESDWIIWTNQKITLIIFWLVKNGKDWNPAIPLVKRIFLVPDHIWPKTIKGQPALTHVIRNYVLLLVVPPLCLWWVTHSDESAQAQNSSRATTTLVSQPPHSTDKKRVKSSLISNEYKIRFKFIFPHFLKSHLCYHTPQMQYIYTLWDWLD